MARQDLSAIPNREPLRRLASGLEIARARKHEPIDFSRLNRNQIERLTDKRFGSKFLPEWTLERLTDWIQEQVELQHWTPQSGPSQHLDVAFSEPVGYSCGKLAHTIRIVRDGRYVHAFPVGD